MSSMVKSLGQYCAGILSISSARYTQSLMLIQLCRYVTSLESGFAKNTTLRLKGLTFSYVWCLVRIYEYRVEAIVQGKAFFLRKRPSLMCCLENVTRTAVGRVERGSQRGRRTMSTMSCVYMVIWSVEHISMTYSSNQSFCSFGTPSKTTLYLRVSGSGAWRAPSLFTFSLVISG